MTETLKSEGSFMCIALSITGVLCIIIWSCSCRALVLVVQSTISPSLFSSKHCLIQLFWSELQALQRALEGERAKLGRAVEETKKRVGKAQRAQQTAEVSAAEVRGTGRWASPV